jgi:hypothetical protein
MRRTGGNKDAPARERAVLEPRGDGGEDLGHLGHPAGAMLAAGHAALVGADKPDAVGAQHRQVALCRGMLPHAHVHRRREQHGCVRGQKQRRGEIACKAMGHPGHEIGGGRGHDDEIGRARQLYMPHLGLVGQVEQIGKHLAPGQRRDRKRRHELRPGTGQHGRDRVAALAQPADQVERLVGRDAAADYQKDA